MTPPNVEDLIQISIMVILCLGFTFTYMMENFPNFAHTSYAVLGAITSFYLTRFYRFNPYDTWPFSVIFGGLIGVLLYIFIVRPIKRRGGQQEITLTFLFIVIATLFSSFSYIFSYWVTTTNAPAANYNLSWMDFRWKGIPGIGIIGLPTCVLLVVYLYLFLHKVPLGISLRATAENEQLSNVMGVNTFKAHCLSWFISGGLSAFAGSVIAINSGMGIQGADALLVNVMTGSVLGGLSNVFGALMGGFLVAVAQKTFGTLLFHVFGVNALKWTGLYPIVFLVFTLSFFPEGLTDTHQVRRILEKMRNALRKT